MAKRKSWFDEFRLGEASGEEDRLANNPNALGAWYPGGGSGYRYPASSGSTGGGGFWYPKGPVEIINQETGELVLTVPQESFKWADRRGPSGSPGAAGGAAPGSREWVIQQIRNAEQIGYGRDATPERINYWLSVLDREGGYSDYWYQRMLGMGAGPQDWATAGPYAYGRGYSSEGGTGGGVGEGAWVEPWTREFSAPTGPTWAQGLYEKYFGEGGRSPFEYPEFQRPEELAGAYPEYRAPSREDLTQDPSFQFRLKEGQKALERGAAARGTLLTGGTLKDLGDYSQGLASTEYANVDERRFRDWATGLDRAFRQDEAGFGRALNTWGTNYNRLRGEESDLYGRWMSEDERRYGRAFGEYELARDIFYRNQDRPFEKIYSLAQLGRY